MKEYQNSSSVEGRRLARTVASMLLALTGARLLFVFVDSPGAWGINTLSFLPAELAVAFVLVALGVTGWSMVRRDKTPDEKKWSIDPFSVPARIAVPLIAGILFFVIQIPTALLGDAALFEGDLFRHVVNGLPVPLYREPLTMLMEGWLADILATLKLSTFPVLAYRVTGVVSGIIFVAAAHRIAMLVRGGQSLRVLSFVLLVSCGGVLLFFGYVENYAPQYALILVYAAALLHMIRFRTSPVWPAAALAVCCALHLQNVLLVPSLAIGLAARRADPVANTDAWARKVYLVTASVIPALGLVYAYFQWRPIAALESGGNPFIPFVASDRTQYTLLSSLHLLDIVNEHLLLASVPLVVLAAVVLVTRKRIRWLAPEMVCIVIAALGLESFLIAGNLVNGMGRDWDIVTSLGPLLTLIVILALEGVTEARLISSRLMIAIGAVAIVGSIGWIAVNTDSDAEVVRYRSLLGYYRPVVTHAVTRYAFENLRKMYLTRKDFAMESQTVATMLDILPWHFDLQNAIVIAKLASVKQGSSAGEQLAQMIQRLIRTASDSTLRSETAGDEGTVRIAPPHAGDPCTLGDLIVHGTVILQQVTHTWTLEDAQAFADTIIDLRPTLPYGYELKGWLYVLSGERNAGTQYLFRAIQRDGGRAHPPLILAVNYAAQGIRDSAIKYSVRSLQLDAGYPSAIKLLYSSMRSENLTSADTSALDMLIRSTQLSLAQAKERSLEQQDIADLKSIQHEVLAARRNAATVTAP